MKIFQKLKNSLLSIVHLQLFILLIGSSQLDAQNFLSGAESIAYHAPTNYYYVSSLMNNRIIQMDRNGNQTLYYTDIIAFGSCIIGDMLYVSSGNKINGIDLTTGQITFDIVIPAAIQFDGMTYDNKGNLFVVESRLNLIYKIDLSEKTYTLFVNSGLEGMTQDLIFDKFHNRILACAFAVDSYIVAIDPETGELTKLVKSWGGFDGITIDDKGFIYLSSYVDGGKIIMYDNNFILEPIIIAESLGEPTGLDFDPEHNLLAVPTFAGSSVEFIDLPDNYLYLSASADFRTGHAPAAIHFSSINFTNQNGIQWEWDFNNDGVVDSQEENPVFTFTEPGTYTVNLKIKAGTLEKSISLDNYINIFNGQSAAGFSGEGNSAFIPADSQFNLTDKFTFESVIKPSEYKACLIADKGSFKLYLYGTAAGPIGDNTITIDLTMTDGKIVKLTSPNNSIELDKWQHVAFTYDGSALSAKLYINGTEIPISVIGANQLSGDLKPNSENNLFIGVDDNGSRGYNGAIDEMRIWNVVRSSQEIIDNMDNNLSGDETGLIGYWKFDEGSGSDLIDDSPSSFNGIFENGMYVNGADLSTLTSVEDNEQNKTIPLGFSLAQNFPNPFNPSTMISYQLPVNSKVTLKVYDVLGREMATLVDEYQSVGIHSVEFHCRGLALASGVYFYSIAIHPDNLSAGSIYLTKKMILTK